MVQVWAKEGEAGVLGGGSRVAVGYGVVGVPLSQLIKPNVCQRGWVNDVWLFPSHILPNYAKMCEWWAPSVALTFPPQHF